MDMITLKSLVVELRDSGMTFQEIADSLESNYGVKRTRQAVCSLYSRAKQSEEHQDSQRLTRDIVNLYCLLENATKVYEEISKYRDDVTYRYILKVLESHKSYISSVQNTIIAGIESRLNEGLTDIREACVIEYKGVIISKKRFDEYFEAASKHHIRSTLEKELITIYKLTNNKQMVRNIAQQFNIALVTEDLKV